MQAAQIKYIYVYAPVCQGRELFLSPVKRGVSFWVTAKGFSIVPQFFFGLPGTRVSRLIDF